MKTASHFMPRDYFSQLYSNYQKQFEHLLGKPLPAANILFTLFFAVIQCGGVQHVIRQQLWSSVHSIMSDSGVSNVPMESLLALYMQLFGQFEGLYFKQQAQFLDRKIVSGLYTLNQITAPKNVKESSDDVEYKPLKRQVDSFGGQAISNLLHCSTGAGEAKSRRILLTKDDLAIVDTYRMLMMLKSGQQLQILEVVRTLLILSNSPECDFVVRHNLKLYKELLALWNQCWTTHQNAGDSSFWPYAQLITTNIYLNDISCDSPSSGSDNIAELSLALETIFRNLTMMDDNSIFMSRDLDFIECLFRWASFMPSPDGHDVDLALQHRKNFLTTLQNIALHVHLDLVEKASFVTQLLIDLMGSRNIDRSPGNFDSMTMTTPFDDLVWLAMDIFSKLTVSLENRDMLAEIDDEYYRRLLPLLIAELPKGYLRETDHSSASVGRSMELITVQTAILCIEHFTSISPFFCRLLCENHYSITTICQCALGVAWVNVPVILKDPGFASTKLGSTGLNDYRSVTAIEREQIQINRISVFSSTLKVLANLVNNEECRRILCDDFMVNSHKQTSEDVLQARELMSVVENTLVMVTLTGNAPKELAGLSSTLLYRLTLPFEEQ